MKYTRNYHHFKLRTEIICSLFQIEKEQQRHTIKTDYGIGRNRSQGLDILVILRHKYKKSIRKYLLLNLPVLTIPKSLLLSYSELSTP